MPFFCHLVFDSVMIFSLFFLIGGYYFLFFLLAFLFVFIEITLKIKTVLNYFTLIDISKAFLIKSLDFFLIWAVSLHNIAMRMLGHRTLHLTECTAVYLLYHVIVTELEIQPPTLSQGKHIFENDEIEGMEWTVGRALRSNKNLGKNESK